MVPLLSLFFFLPLLILFSSLLYGFQDIGYSISRTSELVETKEGDLWNLSDTTPLKFSGTIAMDQETPVVVTRAEDGFWQAAEQNFTLVIAEEEIEVFVGSFTRVYQFNSNVSRPRNFSAGDKVWIIGVASEGDNSSVVIRANHLYDEEPDVEGLKLGTFLFSSLSILLILVNLGVALSPHIPRLRTNVRSEEPRPVKNCPDKAFQNRISSEGRIFRNFDSPALAMLFLVFLLWWLLAISNLERVMTSFPKHILVILLQITGALPFSLVMAPFVIFSLKFRVKRMVFHEEGVLFFNITREPLFLDWDDLSNTSAENLRPRGLSQSMSEAINFELSRRRKEVMNAQMETYQQRQSEDTKPSESTTEED